MIKRIVDIVNINIAEFKMNIPAKKNCSHPPTLPQEERTANECPKKSLKLSLPDTFYVFSADINGHGCVDGCITVYVGEWS